MMLYRKKVMIMESLRLPIKFHMLNFRSILILISQRKELAFISISIRRLRYQNFFYLAKKRIIETND